MKDLPVDSSASYDIVVHHIMSGCDVFYKMEDKMVALNLLVGNNRAIFEQVDNSQEQLHDLR